MLKKLNAILNGTMNKQGIKNFRKLELIQEGFSDRMDLLILKAFTLYQQLLSLPIRAKWDDIV